MMLRDSRLACRGMILSCKSQANAIRAASPLLEEARPLLEKMVPFVSGLPMSSTMLMMWRAPDELSTTDPIGKKIAAHAPSLAQLKRRPVSPMLGQWSS